MKLHNQSLKYLSISILVIIGIWGTVFYYNMLEEIHHSIDEGLSNYKSLVIQKAGNDTSVLFPGTLSQNNYVIYPISRSEALSTYDHYSDTTIYIATEDDHKPMRMLTTAFENNTKYYTLKVISSKVEEDELIENLFWSIIGLYIVLIISIILINTIVLGRLWKPFYNLLQQLQNYRIDRNDPLPDIHTKTQEFIQLKEATATLTRHALDAFNNQKQFTENAAHELQTPLAIASNKLELLLENGKLDGGDAESITQTLDIIARMIQLNKSLLLLSKIENKQFIDSQNISVNHLVDKIINDLEEYIQYKKVTLQIDDLGDAIIKMDPILAHILFSNLIKNAIFHNKRAGGVRMIISHSSFMISNTPENLALDPNDIFKRFYKGSPSQQSTGLGLSIVKAICQIYNYTLSYSFNKEHCFEINFS